MFKKAILFSSLAIGLSACASGSDSIEAQYVSPTLYQNLSCAQLREEATRVAANAGAAMRAQDDQAGRDAAAATVGAILFWPSLFFIRGDGAKANEVALLKGQMEAIQAVNEQKQCGIVFQTAPAGDTGANNG